MEIIKKICNKCGKEIMVTYAEDMQHFNLSFGYESKFDGERWEFDLCDDCLMEFVETFKFLPKGCEF